MGFNYSVDVSDVPVANFDTAIIIHITLTLSNI